MQPLEKSLKIYETCICSGTKYIAAVALMRKDYNEMFKLFKRCNRIAITGYLSSF